MDTPNLDRLVDRGLTYTNAYSCCPVCVPARYTIRTGRESPATGVFANMLFPDMHAVIRDRCGPYLAETMSQLGYRTFGVGKFHTIPWDADIGFGAHLRSEELYDTPDQRARDAYANWVSQQHPTFDYIEALMGERTEMYYVPQVSPLPAEATVEWWAADRAVELMAADDGRPWFGFVSFIGPHPPFAPPQPWNRRYNPDEMPDPIVGDPAVDHRDDYLPWMNYAVWAEDVSPSLARTLKARYYAEITFIDHCLGRILDAVDQRPDAENTLICFFADHGDLLGDHGSWQKDSFFEASARIPCLLSWPVRLPAGGVSDELVSLADLFGLATTAAGRPQLRDGVDLLGTHVGTAARRDLLYGIHSLPGTAAFKIMVRQQRWKYIYLANGGREQLFDLAADPNELTDLSQQHPEIRDRLHFLAVGHATQDPALSAALDLDDDLRQFEFQQLPRIRIHQFDRSRGVNFFSRPTR